MVARVRSGRVTRCPGASFDIQLLRKGAIMKSSFRSLTTGAGTAALVALTFSFGAQSQVGGAQVVTAVPNAESNRFTPSTQPLDAETAAPAPAAGAGAT